MSLFSIPSDFDESVHFAKAAEFMTTPDPLPQLSLQTLANNLQMVLATSSQLCIFVLNVLVQAWMGFLLGPRV